MPDIDDVLKPVVKLLKQGQFTNDLRQKIDDLWGAVNASVDKENAGYFKASAIVSEVKFYFGEVEAAREAVRESRDVNETLNNWTDLHPDSKRVAREKIRSYQAWIHVTDYHNHNYKTALNKIDFCRKFLSTKLYSEAFPSHGSAAQTEFLRAKILRQLHRYSESEGAFKKSIELYNKRAEQKRVEIDEDSSRSKEVKDSLIRDEMSLLNRKCAVSLLGLCWLDYTRSQLDAADQKAVIAHALLMPFADPINHAYLDRLRASICRCRAKRRAQLNEALEFVDSSKARLSKAGLLKHPYMTLVEYEKSLIHLALARHQSDAEFSDHVRAAAELAEKLSNHNDNRWKANGLIVKSRVVRRSGDFALAASLASEARDLAEHHSQVLCQVDALIAHAEAHYHLAGERLQVENLAIARQDLQVALELNKDSDLLRTAETQNAKISAVIWLNIARTFVLERDKQQAEAAFLHWKELEKEVEHEGVRDFARVTRKEIDGLNVDFVIPYDSNVEYDQCLDDLRKFLIKKVKAKFQGEKQQAKALGISRQSLRNWSQPAESTSGKLKSKK